MKGKPSRRTFLSTGAALVGQPCLAADRPQAGPIEAEIRRRADHALSATRLEVDYYRIYRRLAYPLPVTSLSIPSMPVPGIPDYPWSIWMLWELENRLHALSWAAKWFRDERCAATAQRDLRGLASFPKYCQLDKPDLAAGHAGRILYTAAREWAWLAEPVRAACRRHVDEVWPLARKHYGPVRGKQDIEPAKLHNIALIGTIGAALTANLIGDPAGRDMNVIVRAIFESILDRRSEGYTEGVGYDGYILDFIGDWLQILPPVERDAILDHPNLDGFLRQSYLLGAPGAMHRVAELHDVEARQMPFHFSGQAKLARWRPTPLRGWYLKSWPASAIRSDALGWLHPIMDKLPSAAPPAGAANAHYAAVLRDGWEDRDLACVMSATNSTTGHMQMDSGTLVIGTHGEWILSDPGYQQYMESEEREFTLGPAAHNYPVVNGLVQDKKQSHLLRCEGGRITADLTACYPAGLRSVKRHVWLAPRAGVVVADEIEADAIQNVKYHWHGHHEASWWTQDGWLLLHVKGANLWFASPQTSLTLRNVTRLPGSRGQLTAAAEFERENVIWWVFSLGDTPPPMRLETGKRNLHVLGRSFTL